MKEGNFDITHAVSLSISVKLALHFMKYMISGPIYLSTYTLIGRLKTFPLPWKLEKQFLVNSI